MVNYVVADPAKNITVLVTDNVPKEERAVVTEEIFASVPACEQVGYITEPILGGSAAARIEMMGGEFCGNATLSLAAYIALRDGITEPGDVEVECSGVDKVITCRLRPLGKAADVSEVSPTAASATAAPSVSTTAAPAVSPASAPAAPSVSTTAASSVSPVSATEVPSASPILQVSSSPSPAASPASPTAASSATPANHRDRFRYEGTIGMPVPEKTEYCDSHPVVFLPGIAHMIMPADRFTRRQTENNIRDYAARYDVEAFGILLWDETRQFMSPCVYVKESDTVVWENGCATGSTCIGWYRFREHGLKVTEVRQPGGMIRIDIRSHIPYLTGTVEI